MREKWEEVRENQLARVERIRFFKHECFGTSEPTLQFFNQPCRFPAVLVSRYTLATSPGTVDRTGEMEVGRQRKMLGRSTHWKLNKRAPTRADGKFNKSGAARLGCPFPASASIQFHATSKHESVHPLTHGHGYRSAL